MQRYNVCEIDLAAIRHNVGVMKSHIAGGAKFLAVVKADAYGHGAVPVAKAALEAGADMLAVAIPEEGIELRNAGIAAPILVLGGIEESAAEAVVQYNLTQVVFDESRIRALAQAGRKLGQNAQVHLKLDTGMNRIGVRTEEEAQALTRLIDSLSGIELTGCFTHMATADEDDPTGTLKQIAKFDVLCRADQSGASRQNRLPRREYGEHLPLSAAARGHGARRTGALRLSARAGSEEFAARDALGDARHLRQDDCARRPGELWRHV